MISSVDKLNRFYTQLDQMMQVYRVDWFRVIMYSNISASRIQAFAEWQVVPDVWEFGELARVIGFDRERFLAGYLDEREFV